MGTARNEEAEGAGGALDPTADLRECPDPTTPKTGTELALELLAVIGSLRGELERHHRPVTAADPEPLPLPVAARRSWLGRLLSLLGRGPRSAS